MQSPEAENPVKIKRPLEYVAAWQFLCFLLLICFIWASELLDIKHVLYGTPRDKVDWSQAWLLTAATITVGIITVGQTYILEKRILRGFIIVCSYCHKVQINKAAWQQMEAYFIGRTRVDFSHGVCPSCYERVMEELQQRVQEENAKLR